MIASVALLLSNRVVWGVSLVLAIMCVGTSGYTFQATRRSVAAAQDKIQKAADNVIQIEKDDDEQ